jgi:hypothetical protein
MARISGNGSNDIPMYRGIANSATTEPTDNNVPIHRASVTRADSTTYPELGYGCFCLNFHSLSQPCRYR